MKNDLNWGNVTPDGFNEKNNEALFVYNVDLTSQTNMLDTILFVSGRIIWNRNDLPENCMQQIVFDIRGQKLNDNAISQILKNIDENVIKVAGNFYNNYSINFKTK